jgi:hypothetical protein
MKRNQSQSEHRLSEYYPIFATTVSFLILFSSWFTYLTIFEFDLILKIKYQVLKWYCPSVDRNTLLHLTYLHHRSVYEWQCYGRYKLNCFNRTQSTLYTPAPDSVIKKPTRKWSWILILWFSWIKNINFTDCSDLRLERLCMYFCVQCVVCVRQAEPHRNVPHAWKIAAMQRTKGQTWNAVIIIHGCKQKETDFSNLCLTYKQIYILWCSINVRVKYYLMPISAVGFHFTKRDRRDSIAVTF